MNRKLFIIIFVLLTGFLSVNSSAVVELNEFSSEEQRARYTALIEELRCPKCQNQNLAGSDSVVAVDLRREVFLMLSEGYSDKEIRDFMQERYGDFILYNPPVSGKTLLVWLLPLMFFICGIFAAVYIIRNATRNAAMNTENDESDTDLDELDFNQEQVQEQSSSSKRSQESNH